MIPIQRRTAAKAQHSARILFPLIALLVLQLAAVAALAQLPSTPTGEEIQALVGRGTLPPLHRPDFAPLRSAVEDIYREADYAPRWLAPDSVPRAMVAELADAPSHGLNAADYDVEWLGGELEAIEAGDRSPQRVARADVALTVSFFRFASDLHRGRVTPEQAGFKFSEGQKPLDLAALLRTGTGTGRWSDVVASAEPSFPLYRRLKEALARYRTFASVSLPSMPALPSGKRKIAPGESYAGTAAIMERLRLVGDLPANASIVSDDQYQGAIVEAVRAYQDRHGLEADGVLGIRVEDPPALAAFVLRDQPAWTAERIGEAMAAGKQSTAMLTHPLPVVLFYTTAIVDAAGKVRFASDVYGLDAKLEQALRTR